MDFARLVVIEFECLLDALATCFARHATMTSRGWGNAEAAAFLFEAAAHLCGSARPDTRHY
jgi:hypothetical protein